MYMSGLEGGGGGGRGGLKIRSVRQYTKVFCRLATFYSCKQGSKVGPLLTARTHPFFQSTGGHNRSLLPCIQRSSNALFLFFLTCEFYLFIEHCTLRMVETTSLSLCSTGGPIGKESPS
jgi:hypothetical protein